VREREREREGEGERASEKERERERGYDLEIVRKSSRQIMAFKSYIQILNSNFTLK